MRDQKLCNGHRSNGEPCKGLAMPNGKCRKHGGKTPIGIASPHFKHGKRSKYTAIGLAERIRQAMGDPSLLDLRSAVATADVRINELIAMLEAAQTDLQTPTDAHTPTGGEQADLDTSALWEALTQALLNKSKLVESESKRLRLLNQFISADQFMNFVMTIEQSIRANVTDPKALQAIGEDIKRYALTYRLGTDQTIDQEVSD